MMDSSNPILGDDTNSVLRFLSNNHWVSKDIDATTETVIRRIQSLIDQWNRDETWDHNDENLEAENDYVQADALNDNIVRGDARIYQNLMAEAAKQRNTIITLGTGQGKTLIAMLTIRHFRDEYPDKQTWFLVPTVALAIQQADTLMVNLPYTVGIAMSTANNSDTARDNLSKADILVATHGSALDLLHHRGDKFNLQKVNLLVLDECHNATKDHSYASIMDKFYRTISSKDARPHVLGLTASPIINIKRQVNSAILEDRLSELERKLDAVLMSLSSLGIPPEENGVIESNVEEQVIYYKNEDVYSFPQIQTSGIQKVRLKELEQLKFLYEEFGPLLVERYCQVLVVELSQNLYEEETQEQYEALIRYLKAVIENCSSLIHTKTVRPVSMKLKRLEDILLELLNPSTDDDAQKSVGIVFVERRITAVALKHYLTTGASTRINIKCDMLTAASTNIFKYLHYHSQSSEAQQLQQLAHENWLHVMKDIRSVLTKLRRKELDILISTSLIEEGVDVAACSFVVMLDDLKTTKSYIQCKGRARQLSAKFIVFENECKKPPVTLAHASKMESQVKDFIGSRVSIQPVERGIQSQIHSQASSSIEVQALQTGEYRTKLNCSVDLSSSKSTVNRYILAIPREVHARSSRRAMSPYLPVYEEFSLTLPSHLPRHIRHIHLPYPYRSVTNSKAENEAKLALVACVRLHQIEAINDNLLPLSRDDFMKRILNDIQPPFILPCIENIPRTLNSDHALSYYGYIYPILYESETFQSYDTLLGSAGRQLGLFSFRKLQSSVDVTLCHAQFGNVSCKITQEPNKKPVCLSYTEWIICTKFYEVLFNARWRRRTGRKRFRFHDDALKQNTNDKPYPLYIVVSLTSQGDLDCDRMCTITQRSQRSETDRQQAIQGWKQGDPPRLWAPKYSPNATYVAFIDSGSTCSKAFPDAMYANYTDYFLKNYCVSFALDCPLIEAHIMWDLPKSLNAAINNKSKEMLEPILLPKDGCMETPVADASLFLHTTFLPQVLYCMERNETICAFLNHCSKYIPPLEIYLRTIPPQRITEALTAKSCSLPYTYDRLEYLGDAVLKLIQTDSLLYSSNDRLSQWLKCLHEGDLSALRSAMGCNERLQEIAAKYGIDRYIMVAPLDRSKWLPPFLKAYILEASGAEVTYTIDFLTPSNNVQADVIEALLGLIYLHHNFEAATRTAEILAVAFPKQDRHSGIRLQSLSKNQPTMLPNKSKRLSEFTSTFLGARIENKALLDEAFAHPTAINSLAPNYQRLEWLGDSVLCLATREWLWKRFCDSAVEDLVLLESTMVSNEALAWLGFRSGVQRLVNHCDPTLCDRFGEYQDQINDPKNGIWATRPPKVLADVVEALIGAAHIDGGFALGQSCALKVVEVITLALSKLYEMNKSCLYTVMHPQQLLMRLCSPLKLKALAEEEYSAEDIWRGISEGWGHHRASTQHANVGLVSFHGVLLFAAGVKSSRQIAKLRASSILANIFSMPEHQEVAKELLKLSTLLHKREKSMYEKK